MARAAGKRDFATRLSPDTLSQLDALVRLGAFKNRTQAIEAAVERLAAEELTQLEQRRRAFDRACGALDLGIDAEAWVRAKYDRLDWEASRPRGSQR